jgi:hypothetical protein
MTHLLPPAPMVPDGPLFTGRILDAASIAANIVQGTLGECVACLRTCWTWWSAAPPSGYVSLHEGCVRRLRDLWYLALEEGAGIAGDEPPPVATGTPSGAYARRRRGASRAAPAPATPAVSARLGIELPDDFVPGPFWRPGWTHLEPWVVLAQTGRGQVFTPFGPGREHAEAHLDRLRLVPIVMHTVPVVGAVLLSPDGGTVRAWGDAPVVGGHRWESITQLSEWRPCTGCGSPRWPGSWVTVRGGRCRECVEPAERADPRPWPPDPAFPGLATAPHWPGGPKPAKRESTKGDAS